MAAGCQNPHTNHSSSIQMTGRDVPTEQPSSALQVAQRGQNILHEWWGDNRAARKENNPLVYLVFADHYHIIGKLYLTFVAVRRGFLPTSSNFPINDFSSNAFRVTGRNMESSQIIIISKMVEWDFTLNAGEMKMKLVHIKPRVLRFV